MSRWKSQTISIQLILKNSILFSNKINLQLELSATFGLHLLKLWNIDVGSVVLLTAALEVGVETLVIVVAPPLNIDASALALAKLSPIALDFGGVADEVGVENGDTIEAVIGAAAFDLGNSACTVAAAGVLGFAAATTDTFAPLAIGNENPVVELVLASGTALTIGLFSLSFFDWSAAELKAFATSNLNVDDVAGAVTAGALDNIGG